MKALRLCQKAASTAAQMGFVVWTGLAIGFLATREPLLWLAAYAFAGGALIAGIISVGLWSIGAVIQTRRNLGEVIAGLPSVPIDAPYVEDRSEILTRAAMKRAADSYQRSLEPSFLQQRGAL